MKAKPPRRSKIGAASNQSKTAPLPALSADPRQLMASDDATLEFGRNSFSNLNKQLYPSGFTKREVLAYYAAVAPVMVPHLQGRGVTLKRYPNGSDQPFFFEKRCPPHRPDWLKTVEIPSKTSDGGRMWQCTVEDRDALLWLVNLASLELHVLLSKASAPSRPTVMVFDLDPGEGQGILDCVELALEMRDLLQHLGLESFAKTSGNKGIHFYVPLNTPVTFDQTKEFSNTFAQMMEKRHRDRVTSNMSKALRKGKIFIDWSQNDQHKTTACVYTLRAIARPMVSTPVTWDEMNTALTKKDPVRLQFDAAGVIERVGKLGDLFQGVLTLKQNLPGV